VSIQVKQLESYAGLPLFEQLGKRVFLTAAGQELLQHCRAIIGQFRAAQEAMTQLSGVVGGTLNVAVISAGDYFFPPAPGRVQAPSPGGGSEPRRAKS
jgi:DNA-binding transcriptional LysR family regulator